GYELYNIARAASGQIPQRDFGTVYPPGVYALAAPIYAWFGERVWPVRELLVAVRAAAVMLAFLISRRFLPLPFALLATGFSLAYWGWLAWNLATPYAALFTIPLCMLSLYLLLLALARDGPRLYLAAGLVCGVAVLFKWTLAVMAAYGAVVAIVCVAMLESRTHSGSRRNGPVAFVWAGMALLLVVAFWSMLSVSDYLLHIAPVHAVMGIVAYSFMRDGDGAAVVRRSIPSILWYGLGFAIVPLATLALYGAWGHAGDLLYNTIVRPLGSPNYYVPVALPELRFVATMGCVAALVTALLAGIGRKLRVAAVFAVAAVVLAPLGYPEGGLLEIQEALGQLLFHLPAITAYAATGVLAWDLVRGSEEPAVAAVLIPVLLFQMMMSFQIFPRAGYNITLMMGVLAPIVGYLACRWSLLAVAGTSVLRRSAAFALAGAIALCFVHARVAEVLRSPWPADAPERTFRHRALEGIRPGPEIWERDALAAFDELVETLETLEPADAPLFVIPNMSMVYFLSDREPLFEDRTVIYFLAGWNLLPPDDRDRLLAAEIEARFEAHPETIVVTRVGDESTAHVDATFPNLLPYLSRHYQPVASFGPYRILRR
ncbi:MAG: glycosyltransferase family 39 protein, partial [bacterium]|nr:glycosyltransferase family 39 protein [bacterium]